MDESLYDPKDNEVEKEQSFAPYTDTYTNALLENNHTLNPVPFLLSASKIMTGSGKALVCAVGENTRLAKGRADDGESAVLAEQKTFLEE